MDYVIATCGHNCIITTFEKMSIAGWIRSRDVCGLQRWKARGLSTSIFREGHDTRQSNARGRTCVNFNLLLAITIIQRDYSN